jgi:hypothetical protein
MTRHKKETIMNPNWKIDTIADIDLALQASQK